MTTAVPSGPWPVPGGVPGNPVFAVKSTAATYSVATSSVATAETLEFRWEVAVFNAAHAKPLVVPAGKVTFKMMLLVAPTAITPVSGTLSPSESSSGVLASLW